MSRIIGRLKQSTQLNPNVLLLAKTVGVMVFTLHWSACIYWLIVRTETESLDIVHCNDEVAEECNEWHPPGFIKRDTGKQSIPGGVMIFSCQPSSDAVRLQVSNHYLVL